MHFSAVAFGSAMVFVIATIRSFLCTLSITELEKNMNFIIWIVLGGVIGWLASLIMKTDAQQGVFLNIVVGVVGAFLGGLIIAPLIGTGTINQNDFSIASIGVSLIGAVVLLAIVNLIRRGTTR